MKTRTASAGSMNPVIRIAVLCVVWEAPAPSDTHIVFRLVTTGGGHENQHSN